MKEHHHLPRLLQDLEIGEHVDGLISWYQQGITIVPLANRALCLELGAYCDGGGALGALDRIVEPFEYSMASGLSRQVNFESVKELESFLVRLSQGIQLGAIISKGTKLPERIRPDDNQICYTVRHCLSGTPYSLEIFDQCESSTVFQFEDESSLLKAVDGFCAGVAANCLKLQQKVLSS